MYKILNNRQLRMKSESCEPTRSKNLDNFNLTWRVSEDVTGEEISTVKTKTEKVNLWTSSAVICIDFLSEPSICLDLHKSQRKPFAQLDIYSKTSPRKRKYLLQWLLFFLESKDSQIWSLLKMPEWCRELTQTLTWVQ